MSLIADRSREIRDRFTSGAIGFYTSGQLFLEEYYTLGRHRQGGPGHAAHGRQHPALYGDRRRGA